mmetsp:Transcript_995/g.4252  ORF Transcript_995/g.4252 Transcript_995/m.4252 type:complete len:136 (-) Transcript_995:2499-2906(-)
MSSGRCLSRAAKITRRAKKRTVATGRTMPGAARAVANPSNAAHLMQVNPKGETVRTVAARSETAATYAVGLPATRRREGATSSIAATVELPGSPLQHHWGSEVTASPAGWVGEMQEYAEAPRAQEQPEAGPLRSG